jgi:hypothetical protein
MCYTSNPNNDTYYGGRSDKLEDTLQLSYDKPCNTQPSENDNVL